MERRLHAKIDALPVGSMRIVQGRQTWEVLTSTLRATWLLVILVAVYFWLQFVLAQFPWTRRFSLGLLKLLADPLLQIGQGFIDYLPDFLFLLVLAVITRYGLRILRLYFEAVARGTLTLHNFEAEWALPTYKILRTLDHRARADHGLSLPPGVRIGGAAGHIGLRGPADLARRLVVGGQRHRRLHQHLRARAEGRRHDRGRRAPAAK